MNLLQKYTSLSFLFAVLSLSACDKGSSVPPNVHAEPSIKQQVSQNKNSQLTETKDKNEEKKMANPKLKVGDKAPAWKLDSDNNGTVDSETLKGQKYILYFYPKDMTKGCTVEANDFHDLEKDFAEKGYKIFGVSADSLESHKTFRDKYELGFTLLSDPDHKVAEAFGVWREKNVYGKNSVGMIRSTFVVDDKEIITHVFDNVRATGHVERLLKEL